MENREYAKIPSSCYVDHGVGYRKTWFLSDTLERIYEQMCNDLVCYNDIYRHWNRWSMLVQKLIVIAKLYLVLMVL